MAERPALRWLTGLGVRLRSADGLGAGEGPGEDAGEKNPKGGDAAAPAAQDGVAETLARRQAELAALTAAFVRKEDELDRVRRAARLEAERLRADLARAEQEVLYVTSLYEGSTSWRLTAPIRGLTRLLRRQ